jgi:hypothetical protein
VGGGDLSTASEDVGGGSDSRGVSENSTNGMSAVLFTRKYPVGPQENNEC